MKDYKFSGITSGCLLALLTVGLLLTNDAQAAKKTVGKSVYHDTSAPLSNRALHQVIPTGKNKTVPLNEKPGRGRFPDLAEPDGSLPAQSSPAQLSSTAQLLDPTPAAAVSFPGLGDDENASTVGWRVVPPDVNGDIGLDDGGNLIYVQYINSIWGVYDVSGNLVSGPFPGNSFWVGFGGFCQTNNDGDPIVLYDDQAGRWVFSQFSINEGIQCVAVSKTSNPLGPYHRYAFTVSPGKQNDYPKLGVWTDGSGQSAYTFTTRDFPWSSTSFMGAGVMERDKMLAGADAQFVKFENPCVGDECIEGQLPPHLAGPPPPAGTCPTFWTAVDAAFDDSPWSSDGYRNHTLCVDWADLYNNTTYTEGKLVQAGSNFDRFLGDISPVSSGGNLSSLDSLPNFTMYRAQYRWFGTYGSVLLNTTVDAGSERAGIRWAEARSADGDSGWTLQQDGTFAPADGLERWMGSIAQDQDGNIALGYSVTGSSLLPAVRYTTRMAGDAAGTMPGGEVSCIEGTGAQTGSNRWGDYSSMSVDPTDDCTFWYTQEYYETTGSWDFDTRICSFRIPSCGDPAVVDEEAPSVPGAVQVGSVTENSINISWGASTDNIGVTGYRIFRGDVQHATVSGTSFADTGLSPGTSYAYKVGARDAAGNLSDLTASVSATTDAIPPDVITLIDATYKSDRDEFKVRATSSKQPDVTMEVVGFGAMTFKNGKYEYKRRPTGGLTIPPTVDIVSSGGGSLTVTVVGAPTPPVPAPANTPNPANEQVDVSTSAMLDWTAGANTDTHDVYFGNSSSPPFKASQSTTGFDPGTLTEATTYYWRIDESNAYGRTTGTTWSFTTVASPQAPGKATNPTPANAAGDVDVNANLGWSAGSQALTHTVYFGTSPTPVDMVSSGQTQTSFEPGVLNELTTYYWRVDETNGLGTTTGSIWSFTTRTAAPVDTVIVSKAEWKASTNELKVEATSSGAPAAVLSVQGFGQMSYNSSKRKYTFAKKPVSNPGTVTVTSSIGGSANKSVRQR